MNCRLGGITVNIWASPVHDGSFSLPQTQFGFKVTRSVSKFPLLYPCRFVWMDFKRRQTSLQSDVWT